MEVPVDDNVCELYVTDQEVLEGRPDSGHTKLPNHSNAGPLPADGQSYHQFNE